MSRIRVNIGDDIIYNGFRRYKVISVNDRNGYIGIAYFHNGKESIVTREYIHKSRWAKLESNGLIQVED